MAAPRCAKLYSDSQLLCGTVVSGARLWMANSVERGLEIADVSMEAGTARWEAATIYNDKQEA